MCYGHHRKFSPSLAGYLLWEYMITWIPPSALDIYLPLKVNLKESHGPLTSNYQIISNWRETKLSSKSSITCRLCGAGAKPLGRGWTPSRWFHRVGQGLNAFTLIPPRGAGAERLHADSTAWGRGWTPSRWFHRMGLCHLMHSFCLSYHHLIHL